MRPIQNFPVQFFKPFERQNVILFIYVNKNILLGTYIIFTLGIMGGGHQGGSCTDAKPERMEKKAFFQMRTKC